MSARCSFHVLLCWMLPSHRRLRRLPFALPLKPNSSPSNGRSVGASSSQAMWSRHCLLEILSKQGHLMAGDSVSQQQLQCNCNHAVKRAKYAKPSDSWVLLRLAPWPAPAKFGFASDLAFSDPALSGTAFSCLVSRCWQRGHRSC